MTLSVRWGRSDINENLFPDENIYFPEEKDFR